MPSSPSSAICGRMPRSNLCARSSSRMRGATSRPAHSRTDCSSRRCSSVSSKFEHQADGATGAMLAGVSAGLRNSTSRRLLLSRNCSVMRSGSNIRWMSRFGNGRCLAARGGIRPVLQVGLIDDDVPRVLGPGAGLRLRRVEKRQQHAVGRRIRTSCSASAFADCLVEIVEQVPAQDAVDAAGLLREALRQERGELLEHAFTDVAIDVLRQILDDDLAAELLAEETDVGADDRTEIEQHRLRARAQAGDETRQHLGRMDGRIRAPASDSACSLRRRENRSESATDLSEPGSSDRLRRPEDRSSSALVRGRCGLRRGRWRRLRLLGLRARRGLLLAWPAARPCAACRRCRGSAHPRQWPRAAR